MTVSYPIEAPFTDSPNQYTLTGSTELEAVRWTVTVLRAGTQLSETTYTQQTFNQSLDLENGGDQIVVELDGTTPSVENYTYSPEETYLVTSLAQSTGKNSDKFVNASAHHYTVESKKARSAIATATSAIDDAGGQAEAEQLVDNAKTSYSAGEFGNAISLATQAKSKAADAKQSQQTTSMLLLAGGIVVVLAIVGGGIYYWKSQQEEYSRL